LLHGAELIAQEVQDYDAFRGHPQPIAQRIFTDTDLGEVGTLPVVRMPGLSAGVPSTPAPRGGFSLALMSDFVLATPRARFCQVFGRIGLVLDMAAMYMLPRIVGLQRAKELMFSARVMSADEAMRLGIVYALHEPQDLLGQALALARRFTEASPVAIGLTKNILNQSFQLDQRALAELESYAQGLCMDSEYHREAVRRFLAREPLAFPGLDDNTP